ncbi:prepilin-type N-terminal cleavage/methylation domain-containing protein [Trichlorobacter sp.]|uniref:PulJ/GspJ family protein n=1 Tax=Trichlorobacter sp. TaxID=2911007 RepID=UPI002A36751A|nr:prepilin-type N-terminal cleavage/methylation domain-containing protein [Trichlorobacter sp.]MDY0385112.1 prepilin-type N-terminal cleavage/methylation domain-containing protein [Trichlorobacter sp.]
MQHGKKGFTLVEMIIVMLIFMLVIMAASSSFNVLLTQMAKLTKSEESNIEGVVGLEMLRHDLQQTGFGLPDAYLEAAPPTYGEASIDPADDYNDAPNGLPRAVVAGNDLLAGVEVEDTVDGVGVTYALLTGSDYLALKGVTLGMDETAQKWTYLPFESGITGLKKPRIWGEAHLNLVKDDDRVVVIKKKAVKNQIVNQMIYDTADAVNYWTTFDPDGLPAAFSPTLPEEVLYVYGIRGNADLSMPFNRSDYFVANPDAADRRPNYCAPGTGILYKARVAHDEIATTGYASGALQPMPLLDCVADMQVVFGWDLTDTGGQPMQDGQIDTYSNADGSTVSGTAAIATVQSAMADAEQLRNTLKMIKIYLLAQNGRRDQNYQSPTATIVVGNPTTDGVSKNYPLTAAQRGYRWKVYQLVVRPKNLMSNQ